MGVSLEMRLAMKKIKTLVSTIINDNFIYHLNYESWGVEILIMEKTGVAFARIYWCNDDIESIYLNWLSVVPESRNKGIATQLQIIREEIGRKLGYKYAYLQVEESSWMHEWYKRRGYEDYDSLNKDENLIWMGKLL